MFIKVYAFEDAPQELRHLSEHGGDEDWVVVAELTGDPNQDEDIMAKFDFVIMNLDRYDFGSNEIHRTKLNSVELAVYIIAHS